MHRQRKSKFAVKHFGVLRHGQATLSTLSRETENWTPVALAGLASVDARGLLPVQACLEAAAVATTARFGFFVDRDFRHLDVRHLDFRDVIVTILTYYDTLLRSIVHQLGPLALRRRVHRFINSFPGG